MTSSTNNEWDLFYTGAVKKDGSLYFPERLTKEFLEQAKRHMGRQFYANQYDNIVIDDDSKPFKASWLKYYDSIPKNVYRFIFIDPAISQADAADFTAVAVVAVDSEERWYLEHSSRHKITPTQIINLIFQLCEHFDPMKIGIEDVAFQKVLVYMMYEEMKRRNIWIPLEGIKPPNDKTKEMKILGLIPRFQWGRILINKGLHDFEAEYMDYAGERSKHDDQIDALASIEALITYPKDQTEVIPDLPPNDPMYEYYYRRKLQRGDIKTRE